MALFKDSDVVDEGAEHVPHPYLRLPSAQHRPLVYFNEIRQQKAATSDLPSISAPEIR
jgi:hypothetical protein